MRAIDIVPRGEGRAPGWCLGLRRQFLDEKGRRGGDVCRDGGGGYGFRHGGRGRGRDRGVIGFGPFGKRGIGQRRCLVVRGG